METRAGRQFLAGARGLWLAAVVLLAAGCSGGGGGGTPVTPPATTYTVTYSGNGNTGGTVPVDTGAYLQGAAITVLGNTGNLVKSGSTFAGWNTLADGTGSNYLQGQTCAMGAANLTFHAHWTVNPASGNVTYDGNGATAGSVPVDGTTYATGQTVTVLGNPGSLVYTGYTFLGWQTKADGSGTAYKQGQTFTKGSGSVTLYALWAGGYTYVANTLGGVGGQHLPVFHRPQRRPHAPFPGDGVDGREQSPLHRGRSAGRYVYASNVSSNTVAQFAVGADGTLSPMATPTVLMGVVSGGQLYYPSALAVHPAGTRVYVPLQQANAVNQYAVGSTGALAALAPATVTSGDPGNGRNGPNAAAIVAAGTYAYVANGGANTVSQYRINADGTLAALSPFLVPSGGVSGSGSAFDVKTTTLASGTFVYVTNYFDGTVAQFSVNASTGQLTPLSPALVKAGTYAFTLAIHPTGKFAYVAILTATSAAVVAQYAIDPATGALTAMATPTVSAGGAGAAVITVESSGRFAYATSGDTGWGSSSMAQYTIDPTTGALTLMANPTVQTGYAPAGVVTIGK